MVKVKKSKMKSPNSIELKTLQTEVDDDDEDLEERPRSTMKKHKNKSFLFYSIVALVLFFILSLIIVIVLASFYVVMIALSTTTSPTSPPTIDSFNRTTIKQTIQNYTRTILNFGTRVPGEIGNTNTQLFMKQIFSSLSPHWIIEEDSFQVDTTRLIGRMSPFTNIIATLNTTNAQQKRKIILAAHFDSKLFTGFTFLGASDSVASCAMLLHLAQWFTLHKQWIESSPFTIQMVFFDGEEAFINWSQEDSLYGSRHLAQQWQHQQLLSNIEVMILLDLIGCNAPMPSFYDFPHHGTVGSKWYQKMVQLEANRTLSTKYYSQHTYFHSTRYNTFIDDDHRPFYERGVPIVHLIPIPFPNAWHTQSDNESALDYEVVTDIFCILGRTLLKQFGFQF